MTGLDSRSCIGTFRCVLALAVCGFAFQGVSLAGQWPQILGPDRNGKARDEQLLDALSAAGPATLWSKPVGSGFAGVAVAEGTVVLFHRLDGEAIVEALDPKTGKRRWKLAFPTYYTSGIASDDGPRCVPLIHQGHAYLFGAGGDLHCVSLRGEKRWSRELYQDYSAPEGYFGAGTTPIVDAGKLLVNVGGKPDAGLVALSLADGKTLWQATEEQASYSAPTAATIDGVRHAIFVTRLNVVSVDPQTGDVRFRFPFGSRGPTVNAATPLVLDGHLFVSANYGVGARFVKIGKDRAEPIWESDEVMSSQYTTCVEKDGYLYGIDGRQDVGVAVLRCIDPQAGKVLWTKEGFGTGNLILADGKLLIMKTDGELILADPSPKEYRQLASARLFDTTVQALPALADGLLYVRDTKTLKCIDLRP